MPEYFARRPSQSGGATSLGGYFAGFIGAAGHSFRLLAAKWEADTMFTSSVTELITHPLYLRIIGLGPAAIPAIIQELRTKPNHWFVALNALTGEDPTEEGCTFDEAVAAWLDWWDANESSHQSIGREEVSAA